MTEGEMLPVADGFSYLSLIPMPDEDVKPYVHEPVASLPPAVCALLPPVRIVLVPYLCLNADRSGLAVSFQQPPAADFVRFTQTATPDRALMVFSTRSEPIPDFHDSLFHAITRICGPVVPKEFLDAYQHIVSAELTASVHGEVGENSWAMKQDLSRSRKGRKFGVYLAASFEDTMSLYLHGICCDIDVEKGPRQLASKYLRLRLDCLLQFFPPPKGFAVFPEQLRTR